MTQPAHTDPSALQEANSETTKFDAKQLVQLLRRDLKQVEQQLEVVGACVSSPLTQNIAEAADELRHSIDAFLDKAEARSTALTTQAREKSEALHKQMEKHPVAAVSSAFALGYFLGRTVFRHRPHEADS